MIQVGQYFNRFNHDPSKLICVLDSQIYLKICVEAKVQSLRASLVRCFTSIAIFFSF